jgi:hypothetical protein
VDKVCELLERMAESIEKLHDLEAAHISYAKERSTFSWAFWDTTKNDWYVVSHYAPRVDLYKTKSIAEWCLANTCDLRCTESSNKKLENVVVRKINLETMMPVEAEDE